MTLLMRISQENCRPIIICEPCGKPEASFEGYDKAEECLKTKVQLDKYDSITQSRGPVIP